MCLKMVVEVMKLAEIIKGTNVKKKNAKSEPKYAFTLEIGEMKRSSQRRQMGGKSGMCRVLKTA